MNELLKTIQLEIGDYIDSCEEKETGVGDEWYYRIEGALACLTIIGKHIDTTELVN